MERKAHSPSIGQLMLYGLLALPVAAVSLPIYIHIPQFYGSSIGLNLATIGLILLVVRLVDTVQDPLIGLISDRLVRRGVSRLRIIGLSLPLFAISLMALVLPPTQDYAALWLVGCLVLLYTAFSIISINYYAFGAEWQRGYHAQSVISTWREAFILIGIIIASLLPQIFVNQFGEAKGYAYFGVAILLLVSLTAPFGLRKLVAPQMIPTEGVQPSLKDSLRAIARSVDYRWLLAIFFINGVANSIPATLFLFYTKDVLQLPEQSGYFLGLYFLAGLFGMPLWLRLSKLIGKKRCLMLSMVIASLCFVWAFNLQAGDALAFYIICALSGACLGADLAMPPAMLADLVQADAAQQSAGYFGIWNLVWKLTFALAAGVVLPALALMGYTPSVEGAGGSHALLALAMAYALVPSLLKLLTVVLLYVSPLERLRPKETAFGTIDSSTLQP